MENKLLLIETKRKRIYGRKRLNLTYKVELSLDLKDNGLTVYSMIKRLLGKKTNRDIV